MTGRFLNTMQVQMLTVMFLSLHQRILGLQMRLQMKSVLKTENSDSHSRMKDFLKMPELMISALLIRLVFFLMVSLSEL